jgi:SAM-dependent methyltransferase
MRNIGPEAARSYQRRIEAGFFDKYLFGDNILDIGYQGSDPDSVPIVEHAIGVGLDYPGYDGIHLPFPDQSQDSVFASHCYEHISDYRSALSEWYRVLRIGGYIVVLVPHKYLYERKSTPPSLFNADHKRFYTPAALLREFEEALPVNGFRVRHLADNDAGFDYRTPVGQHASGCYEIELVVEKIARPPDSDLFELSPRKKADVEEADRTAIALVRNLLRRKTSQAAIIPIIKQMTYFPTFEIIRSGILRTEGSGRDEETLKLAIKELLRHWELDAAFYVAMHPDLQEAIARGGIGSAREHFVDHGYFEGRVFQDDPAWSRLPARGGTSRPVTTESGRDGAG